MPRGCGYHPIGDAIPGSDFDYTCDDCVLPPNHYDPPELNDLPMGIVKRYEIHCDQCNEVVVGHVSYRMTIDTYKALGCIVKRYKRKLYFFCRALHYEQYATKHWNKPPLSDR